MHNRRIAGTLPRERSPPRKGHIPLAYVGTRSDQRDETL